MSHQNGRLASAEPREADIEMPAIASQPLVEALDQMSVGVIFVDRHGKVAYCNRCADGIIRQADGLSIVTSRLSAAVREETSELRRQIFEAVAADAADGCAAGSTMLLTRPSMRRPLAVLTFPLASATVLLGDHSAPCAVIFVKDPDATEMPSSDVLMRQFGLTRREAELALAVTQGGGLGAAAREIGVSISTARTHLQRVFEKTNTRRQAELIRLILRV